MLGVSSVSSCEGGGLAFVCPVSSAAAFSKGVGSVSEQRAQIRIAPLEETRSRPHCETKDREPSEGRRLLAGRHAQVVCNEHELSWCWTCKGADRAADQAIHEARS